MSDHDGSKFANRLEKNTYQNDTLVHFGTAPSQRDPESWVGVPERLVARLTSLGMAYELHHVQMIDIYDDTTFRSQQCEKLYGELEFLAGVTKDALLGEVINTLAGLLKPVLGKPHHLMVSGN
ncbi:MAG: hypothetical protein GY769_10800 [bacterium]|nr:hypothetical protein [bacterium]